MKSDERERAGISFPNPDSFVESSQVIDEAGSVHHTKEQPFQKVYINYGRMLYSNTAGMLLSFFVSWQEVHGENFFATIELIEEKTGLTRKQQDTAIKAIEEKGLIQKIREGWNGKRHFTVNIEKLQKLLSEYDRLSKRDKQKKAKNKKLDSDCPKGTNTLSKRDNPILQNNTEVKNIPIEEKNLLEERVAGRDYPEMINNYEYEEDCFQ